MRRPERTLGEDGVVIGQVSGDGVDPGALDGFFKSQIRQDGRQPLYQHTLSGARRSDEQGVMKACRSDLQRPLCKFLPHDIGHIRLVRRGAWDESQGLCRLQLPYSLQKVHNFRNGFDPVKLDVLNGAGLPQIFRRDKDL